MIEARAVVLSVEAGLARVRISDRQDGCGRCDEPGGCRSVRLAYAVKMPTDVFSVPDALGVRAGDRVLVRMNDRAPMRGALLSYGLGAVLLIAGAAAGHLIAGHGQEDTWALAGMVGGLAVACAANRMVFRSRRWRNAMQIGLVRDDAPCSGDRVA